MESSYRNFLIVLFHETSFPQFVMLPPCFSILILTILLLCLTPPTILSCITVACPKLYQCFQRRNLFSCGFDYLTTYSGLLNSVCLACSLSTCTITSTTIKPVLSTGIQPIEKNSTLEKQDRHLVLTLSSRVLARIILARNWTR